MKSAVQVMYHKDADHKTVDRLVATHAGELLAAVDGQTKSGRPEQAYLHTDGYVLSAGTRQHVEKQGVTLHDNTEYLIVGMPDDCETAQSIRDQMNADPTSMTLDLNDLD